MSQLNHLTRIVHQQAFSLDTRIPLSEYIKTSHIVWDREVVNQGRFDVRRSMYEGQRPRTLIAMHRYNGLHELFFSPLGIRIWH